MLVPQLGLVSTVGTARVEVNAVNQLGKATAMWVHFAVHGPNGVRLGYSNWIADEIYNPGETATVSKTRGP